EYRHEEIQVHRVPDPVRPAAGADGHPDRRGLPQDGGQRGHLLQLEAQVLRSGQRRAAAHAPARGGERAPEEARRRPVAGPPHAPGGPQKKALRPAQKRPLAQWLIDEYRISARRAAALLLLARTTLQYRPRPGDDAPLAARIREIALSRVRYGFWRIHTLLRREGWGVNHKRSYRVYKLEGLNLRSKRPRRCRAGAHRLERRA